MAREEVDFSEVRDALEELMANPVGVHPLLVNRYNSILGELRAFDNLKQQYATEGISLTTSLVREAEQRAWADREVDVNPNEPVSDQDGVDFSPAEGVGMSIGDLDGDGQSEVVDVIAGDFFAKDDAVADGNPEPDALAGELSDPVVGGETVDAEDAGEAEAELDAEAATPATEGEEG